jgi:hypothetical protein
VNKIDLWVDLMGIFCFHIIWTLHASLKEIAMKDGQSKLMSPALGLLQVRDCFEDTFGLNMKRNRYPVLRYDSLI